MSLFILFQEPFYRAVVASRVIRPLRLPDSTEIKILGYADDSTLPVMDDASLLEIYSLIIKFEKAMGSKLNKNKTKIYGTGNWKNRTQWPLDWIQVENDYLFTLGLYHSNNHNSSVAKNWDVTINSLTAHSNIILNRRLSLHQRVTYANTCMLSKIWYISHTYPLTKVFSKKINKIVFNYVWGGRYEPIRRTTIYRPKDEGGLAIINCLIKSKVIMMNTFLKCYIHDEYRNSLMYYYCYIRLTNMLPSNYSIHNASPITTTYYDVIINDLRNILHIPGFPVTPKDKLYMCMLTKEESLAEFQYPTLNWKNIWKNYMSLFIYSFDKEIVYKHLHVCLATNKKLYTMNLINSDRCNKCTADREQTPLHIFYECENIQTLFMWLIRVLFYITDFKPISNIKFIYFDNKYRNRQQKDMCNIFISVYILTVWKMRKENLRIAILKSMIINKVLGTINIIKHIPNTSVESILGNYVSKVELEVLLRL